MSLLYPPAVMIEPEPMLVAPVKERARLRDGSFCHAFVTGS